MPVDQDVADLELFPCGHGTDAEIGQGFRALDFVRSIFLHKQDLLFLEWRVFESASVHERLPGLSVGRVFDNIFLRKISNPMNIDRTVRPGITKMGDDLAPGIGFPCGIRLAIYNGHRRARWNAGIRGFCRQRNQIAGAEMGCRDVFHGDAWTRAAATVGITAHCRSGSPTLEGQR